MSDGDRLRLWVVGSSNPDPTSWSIWNEVSLVVAATAEQALELAEHGKVGVAEVDMTKAQYLLGQSEPEWGDDL